MSSFRAFLRRRWPWCAGAGILLLGGLAMAAVFGGWLLGGPAAAGPPSEELAPTHQEATPERPDSADDARPVIEIGAVQYMPYTPVWDPPDEGENFWQVVDPENGYPEFGGTTYLLAHACYAGECVGDEARAMSVGEALQFRGDRYLVDEKLEINKSAIAEQAIWEHHEGRVVIITCIIDPHTGAIDENAILVASRVP
ncbi:hypothetical protein [Leucobacter komagatae]|uniref:Sortase family protein n=1 Tax=Leucobacter komagatae TaxID=55969 RepID=A0A0D0HUW2_9MICO|nr:hypothetical protein [Leucobacter komagatae]KIP51401.1 hypothetical protein SD72_15585 [Leucobacter komagatae]